MAEDIENLSEHEAKLKEYWTDVVKHIRRDLAYIWTDDVKRDFQSIKKESGQIALILQKLHRHYKTDKEIYNKEISDIRNLIHHLNRIEAKSGWVKIIYKDLLRVILDVEMEKRKEGPNFFKKLVRKRWLIRWGFPFDKYPVLGNYLIMHWKETSRLAYALKGTYRDSYEKKVSLRNLVFSNLILYEKCIYLKGLHELIISLKEIKPDETVILFQNYLPICKEILPKLGFLHITSLLVRIIRHAGKNFRTLPNLDILKRIINTHGLDDLCTIILSSKPEYIHYRINAIKYNEDKLVECGLRDLAIIAEALKNYSKPNIKEYIPILESDDMFAYIYIKEGNSTELASVVRNLRSEYVGIMIYSLLQLYPLVKQYGLVPIASYIKKIAEHCEDEDLGIVFFLGFRYLHEVITLQNLLQIGLELTQISKLMNRDKTELTEFFGAVKYCISPDRYLAYSKEEINAEYLITNYGLMNLAKIARICGTRNLLLVLIIAEELKRIINDKEDRLEVCLIIARKINIFFHPVVKSMIYEQSRSKAEFMANIKKFEELSNRKEYWTVQGLDSLGYLCCHVTNAFFGGAAGNNEAKKDPFLNIQNDIQNMFDYNPSVSIIGHNTKSSIVVTERDEIKGSIGVVYDYGFIYEAYTFDASTEDRIGKKSGKSYRTSKNRRATESALTVNYSESKYNEVLLRKWTVSGIFYTKGCQSEIIERLKRLSDQFSFKEYVNGAYWYRTMKTGTPQRITKIFPVYEIDTSNNAWKIIYTPQNPNYEVRLDRPNNNTYIAIPR